MKRSTIIPIVLAGFVLAWTDYALAQDDDDDGMAIVWHVEVEDGQSEAFENAVREFHQFMADKEGRFEWYWYSILTGPDTGDYIARSGGHDWADLDSEPEWEDDVDAYFEENVAPFIAEAHRFMTVSDDENSHYPEDWSNMKYINLEDWHVRNGHGRQFNEGLAQISSTLREGEFPMYWAFASNASGGMGNTVTLATFHETWASMAPPSPSFAEVMMEAMSEAEFQSFMSDWGATFTTGRSWTLAMRPDLNPTLSDG